MSESRPETRSSNISLSHGTHEGSLSENHKILQYMDNVFNKLTKVPNANVIIVSKSSNYLKTNMTSEVAKFSYANVSTFADKIKIVMAQLFQDDPLECIRLKGTKQGEIFMTFDDFLDIIVIDKNHGR